MRTLVDIPEDVVARLDLLARRHNRSRAAEVRDALQRYLDGQPSTDWIARGAGYWKDRTGIGDAVEYQRAMRQDRDPA